MGRPRGIDDRGKLIKSLRHAAAKDNRLRAQDMDQAGEARAQQLTRFCHQPLGQSIARSGLKHREGVDVVAVQG